MESIKNDYDYIVTPWPERISKFMHLHYYVAWILISFALFVLYSLSYRFGKEVTHPPILLR